MLLSGMAAGRVGDTAVVGPEVASGGGAGAGGAGGGDNDR
jgi:hypothetical protein